MGVSPTSSSSRCGWRSSTARACSRKPRGRSPRCQPATRPSPFWRRATRSASAPRIAAARRRRRAGRRLQLPKTGQGRCSAHLGFLLRRRRRCAWRRTRCRVGARGRPQGEPRTAGARCHLDGVEAARCAGSGDLAARLSPNRSGWRRRRLRATSQARRAIVAGSAWRSTRKASRVSSSRPPKRRRTSTPSRRSSLPISIARNRGRRRGLGRRRYRYAAKACGALHRRRDREYAAKEGAPHPRLPR